jgi:DNA-binding transcriptional MerR regulator
MKAFLVWLLALLGNECGQVPTDDEKIAESEQVAEPADEAATDGEDGDAIAGEQAQPEAQASFFDPKLIDTLPIDEATKAQLRSTWKAMHGGYNKWIQTERNPLREKAAIVDRFYQDRNFAQQTLIQWAAQNGYQLAPIGQQAQSGQQQQARTNGGPPPELVDAIKQSLPPELQWMAESQAAAHWTANQLSMKPFQERDQQFQAQQQQQKQAQIDQAYEEAAAELREKAPDWEQKETELTQLWDFLTSSQMKNQKFGNKLELLWNMLNGGATATAEATRRMTSAVKNRSSSSMGSTRTVNNLQDRIRQAPNSRDAFKIAAQAAMDKFEGD